MKELGARVPFKSTFVVVLFQSATITVRIHQQVSFLSCVCLVVIKLMTFDMLGKHCTTETQPPIHQILMEGDIMSLSSYRPKMSMSLLFKMT